ncbi:MAG: SGNH/GDSL hydrolase family protein [Spirochaetes bacterium]|nr:SGNH/GDSL hydrolase family protein [Spirochaetota bacterium]
MKKLLVASFIVSLFLAVIGCGMADMTNPTANEFDVVIVGDSIYDLDGFIHANLKTLSGKSYKDYSKSGDTVSYITKQYNTAIAARPTIKTILMDGGGNDILMDVYWSQACQATSTISSACKAYIDGVLDQDEALWEDMNDDGVDNIFHLGYYRLKKGILTTLLYGGTKLNPAVVYADDQLAAACAVSPAQCWFIDPRADFLGKESSYIKSDGIHPTNAGGKVIATKIYNKMTAVGAYK